MKKSAYSSKTTYSGSLHGKVPVRIDDKTIIYVLPHKAAEAAQAFKERHEADRIAHIHSNKAY